MSGVVNLCPVDPVALAARITALPELGMRRAAFAAELESQEAAQLVPVLVEIVRRGRSAGPPFEAALLALVGALSAGLVGYERVGQLYSEARAAGAVELTELFLSPAPERAPDIEPMGLLQRRGRVLTVGERMQAARNTTRTEMDRLLRDHEPRVIRNLLWNPRLVERDVVLLAARRPTSGSIQREIFASAKWICRLGVRRALLRNPYTPTDLSFRLLGLVPRPDVVEVAAALDLPQPLREAAARRLRPPLESGERAGPDAES